MGRLFPRGDLAKVCSILRTPWQITINSTAKRSAIGVSVRVTVGVGHAKEPSLLNGHEYRAHVNISALHWQW